MESIFKSLGIFKLHSNNDPSLDQGLQYEKYRKKELDSTNYELLQESTGSNLHSITEAMKSESSNDHSEAAVENNKNIKSINKLDNTFQKLLFEYTTTLKLMNEESINKENTYGIAKNLYGKVVKDVDSNNVYVNSYGYTHKYSDRAWNNNADNCPSDFLIDNGGLNKLPVGKKMGVGQACDIAGKNIKNNKTGEMAWVDIKGVKHVYSANIWNKRSKNCSYRDTLKLTETEYNAIPSGSVMTLANNCINLDVDPNLYNKLVKLNKKLLHLSKKILEEINKLKIKDSLLNAEIQNQRGELNSYIDILSSDRNALVNLNHNNNTIVAQRKDTQLIYTSNNYQLIAWSLVALAVGGITANQIMKTK